MNLTQKTSAAATGFYSPGANPLTRLHRIRALPEGDQRQPVYRRARSRLRGMIALMGLWLSMPLSSDERLSATELLDRLADLHMPAEPSGVVSASATQWLVMAVIVAVLLLTLAGGFWWRRGLRQRKQSTLDSSVAQRLEQLRQSAADTASPNALWSQGNALLKEIALPLDPATLAALHGNEWVDWLQSRCDITVSESTAYALACACYHSDVASTATKVQPSQRQQELILFTDELDSLCNELLQLRLTASPSTSPVVASAQPTGSFIVA